MTEAKKQIEDAVWNYILARRPLKIAMIVVSAIGVLSGALSALEKPIASAVSNAKYISGVLPPPDAVRQERGAFVAGRLLYEAQIAAGDQDRLRRLFDAMEGSVRLAGYPGSPLADIQRVEQRQAREMLSRFQESFFGHLQSKDGASSHFFLAGHALTKLEYASRLLNSSSEMQESERALRAEIKLAQSHIAYRIPEPELLTIAERESDPQRYDAALSSTARRIHSYLGLPEKIDPVFRNDRVRP